MAKHALLGASSSKRWLACPPSALLEKQFPNKDTAFSNEGTQAHSLGELYLRRYLGDGNFNVEETLFEESCPTDMTDYIQEYADYVIEKYNSAIKVSKFASLLLEQKLDYCRWVPEGFGTGDVVLITDGELEIIDLKYGKGVRVDAEDNSQMRLYALGAYDALGDLYDLKSITMTIYQPRMGNVDSESMSVEDLLAWAEDYVKPRAALAIKGEGEFCAGDHCRFCKAKAQCRARADNNLDLARYDFRDSVLLTNEEIAAILGKVDALVNWSSDVKAYALDQAENHGEHFPGWKLVAGRSNRIITDEEQVSVVLTEGLGFKNTQVYNTKLKGLGDLEKLLGKKNLPWIEPFITKPPGKPTLVVESDKRPAIGSTDSAVRDFSNLGATALEQHKTIEKRLK